MYIQHQTKVCNVQFTVAVEKGKGMPWTVTQPTRICPVREANDNENMCLVC